MAGKAIARSTAGVALQAALDFQEVDLVTLNGASSILRFEAVCGRRVSMNLT